MNTATKTAPEPWRSDHGFFDRCQVAGRTFNVVAVAFEVYEALKLQSFPPAETARFLSMLEASEKRTLDCCASPRPRASAKPASDPYTVPPDQFAAPGTWICASCLVTAQPACLCGL